MLRNRSIIRGPLSVAVVVVSMMFAQGSAKASTDDPFGDAALKLDILAGRDMVDVGDAWFLRETFADHEELHVHFHVPDGFNESHLCLSGAAFTERVSPGQCPYTITTPGTEGDYDIDLGTTYLGGALFAQLHVAGDGWSAYPGSVDPGKGPFYGNTGVDPVEGTDEVVENDETEGDEVIDDEIVDDEVIDGTDETDDGEDNQDDSNDDSNDDGSIDDEAGDDEDGDEVIDPADGTDDEAEEGDDEVVEPGSGEDDPVDGTDDDTDVVDDVTDPESGSGQDDPVDGDTTIGDDTGASESDDVPAALTSSTHVNRAPVEVLGVVLRPSARTSLPRTGADGSQLVVAAAGLLLGGAILLAGSRKSRAFS